MKDQDCSEVIKKIIEEGPTARQALLDNYTNLHQVAEYCERNYLQEEDPKKALEETKAFTTQSLASVAYQISTLATNVLKLLDAQAIQLGKMESSVNLLAQTVDMHREKVARREIGVFTAAMKVPRNQKIIPPARQEPLPKYSRSPIAYSALDAVGHGMKDSGKQLGRTGTMNRKQSARDTGGTLGRTSRPPEPVQCPVAPTLTRGPSLSSLNDRSMGSSFGIAVPPPMVPTWPDTDITSPTMEDSPPPPPLPLLAEINTDVPPPPPLPPPGPGSVLQPSNPPPPPAPPLETVAEENGFPMPPTSDVPLPAPMSDDFDVPAPPYFQNDDFSLAPRSKRSRLPRHPPSSRSGSFRGRLAPNTRSLYTLSLVLPSSSSLIIPPPPPYPPPLAPLAPMSPLYSLSTCLQHLDLEIPPPPPDNMDTYDNFLAPLPPPADYDPSAPTDYEEKVVALYSYNSGNSGDLTFQEGAIIYLTRRNENGWWEGVHDGVEGFFPESYVKTAS